MCRNCDKDYAVIIHGALQQLVLANSISSIQLGFPDQRAGLPGSMYSQLNASLRRIDPPELPWRTVDHALELASPQAALSGHIASLDAGGQAYQLVAINGWPVNKSPVHDYIKRIHLSLFAGRRRKPTQQLSAPAASFVLRIALPTDAVFFSGSVLQRHAMLDLNADIGAVLAQAVHSAWHADMPAVVLANVEIALAGRGAANEALTEPCKASAAARQQALACGGPEAERKRKAASAPLWHAGRRHLLKRAAIALTETNHPAPVRRVCFALQ